MNAPARVVIATRESPLALWQARRDALRMRPGRIGVWLDSGEGPETLAGSGIAARWSGRDAIRERYVVLVFPGNPTSAGVPEDVVKHTVVLEMRKFKPETFLKQNLVQYLITLHLLVLMAAVPLKIVLKLVFNIKYVWVTPWFNV